ncbi:hypothetical protein SAMCFNEI73_pB0225 (plasmid) [Sinorhizobium americanum]|uniref:Uncharacterized protein n=1 Tax=Sinorhizobium americanum TaxID=194963 RepID=A0A1L3LTL5_9HYPH|nr:hypothetical protein SAMCFNEI73_pB0225 [Sinorhizobium americanum]
MTDGQEAVVLKEVNNRKRLFAFDARVSTVEGSAKRSIAKTGFLANRSAFP